MIRNISFIGLGTMGKPMAINLVNAGFDLMVYDIREEPLRELGKLGAKIAQSVTQAAEYGELVEIAVLDDAQVEAVVFGEAGVLAAARPGIMVAIHSTILPKTLRRITESAAANNIVIIDAPISGGEPWRLRQDTLLYGRRLQGVARKMPRCIRYVGGGDTASG